MHISSRPKSYPGFLALPNWPPKPLLKLLPFTLCLAPKKTINPQLQLLLRQ